MIYDENIITEIIDWDWNDSVIAVELEAFDAETKKSYGMSARDYIDFRNKLLIENNYYLPEKTLQEAIVNKLIIGLVAKGFMNINITPDEMKFSISDKGAAAVNGAILDGRLNPVTSPMRNVLHLHNNNELEDIPCRSPEY